MKFRWLTLAKQLKISDKTSSLIWNEVFFRYGEHYRAYHNLNHLELMFQLLKLMVGDDEVPTAVSLAVWFHDIVYDPKSRTNEADSVSLMRQLCEAEVDDALLAEVERLILLTVSHETDEADINGRLLLDADLAILGAERERYQQYAREIRQEYAHVPEEAYRQGRTAVLNHFLQMEPIFLTEYGRLHWEERAKENLRWEMRDRWNEG